MRIDKRATIKEKQTHTVKTHSDVTLIRQKSPDDIRQWVDEQYARPDGDGIKRMFKVILITLVHLLQNK